MDCNVAEYQEWMNNNGGIVIEKRKGKHQYLLFDCKDIKNLCLGCVESDKCDMCGDNLCLYLGKSINEELLCPRCWVVYAECAEDDRLKERIR